MAQGINHYKTDLRDVRFLMFEQFGLEALLGKAPFGNWGKEEAETVLEEVYRWSQEKLGTYNSTGDAEQCRLENGHVKTPDGFKAAWKSLYEAGWRGLAVAEKYGGQESPYTLQAMVEEVMCGANCAFNMYPALTQGASEVIEHFGTPAQKEFYCTKMHSGAWAGTMCLTEPAAGSDVGSAVTSATPIGDGKYKITGTKIFISGGDHDITPNIIHLVLARTPDAPAGTKGLSLFIVPKMKADGTSNDVAVGSIEHKMGIKASATCVLNFGENNNCVGELVGTEERHGMSQMFHLMNFARIGVGMQGLAVASSAYLNALSYAKDRKQGSSIKQWKDASAPRVPIIEHPDVRRMLLDMKSKVEGIRALLVKLTMHLDHLHALGEGADQQKQRDYHQGQVDLLVPLAKSYGSDQAFQICATAIQVMGGAGYLRDWPVEQYCRDAKIFSIYEGTNHIQALDLVGRKLMQRGGANVQDFTKDVGKFIAANKENPVYKDALETLSQAANSLTATGGKFLGWFGGGRMEMVPLAANRFLEMMSEVTLGWLLLEGAIIADAAAAKLPAEHPDQAFYSGRKYSALYFANNTLPGVLSKAALIAKEDRSSIDIPEAAFATALV